MHDAPNAAHHFRVAWMLLKFERLFVEGLQQFLCALEKQLALLGPALVRKQGHWALSIFW
jgi:hypothetical protein